MRKSIVFAAALGIAMVTGSPRVSAAGAGGTYVYVHDRATPNRVFAFSLDGEGQMTALAGSPFNAPELGGSSCGGHCKSVSYSRRHKALYTSHAQGVMAWTVGSDGALAPVAGAPFGGTDTFGVIVLEKGRRTFVYASSYPAGNVRGFEIQPGGALVEVEGSPFAAGAGALGQAAGKGVLCVYNQTDASITSFLVGAHGELTEAPESPLVDTDGDAFYVDGDPKGRYAYVAEGKGILGAAIDRRTGSLVEMEGSPFALTAQEVGVDNFSGGIAVGKRFGYVPGFQGKAVVVQTVRLGRGGALSSVGTPVPSDFNTGDVEGHGLDPSGKHLVFVAESSRVESFLVDRKSGIPAHVETEIVAASSVNGLVVVKR